jgi:hypothetical protein
MFDGSRAVPRIDSTGTDQRSTETHLHRHSRLCFMLGSHLAVLACPDLKEEMVRIVT